MTVLNTQVPQTATKTVAESQVEITQLMRPQQGNFAGNVHGGVLLGLMDEAAYLCASRYSGAYCVTAAVDHVEFHAPVRVGERLSLLAAVNSVGNSSMQVGISVIAEDPRSPDSERRTTRSFFTMIALDDDGSPVTVPRLECETAEDCKWQCEATLRQSLRIEFMERLATGSCQFNEK
ncbi:MAG: acyl-CoA thioesterase [Gemmatimonadota bacterium]